ncbi:unnamed protein product, partial [Amoebophrya sp. A25]
AEDVLQVKEPAILMLEEEDSRSAGQKTEPDFLEQQSPRSVHASEGAYSTRTQQTNSTDKLHSTGTRTQLTSTSASTTKVRSAESSSGGVVALVHQKAEVVERRKDTKTTDKNLKTTEGQKTSTSRQASSKRGRTTTASGASSSSSSTSR